MDLEEMLDQSFQREKKLIEVIATFERLLHQSDRREEKLVDVIATFERLLRQSDRREKRLGGLANLKHVRDVRTLSAFRDLGKLTKAEKLLAMRVEEMSKEIEELRALVAKPTDAD